MEKLKPILSEKDKMNLFSINMNIYLRIILGTLFPDRCSIEEYLIFDDVKQKININEEEGKEIELQVLPDGKTTTWNRMKEKPKQISFSNKEVKALVNVCELASRQKNFPNNPQFFSFYKELKNHFDSISKES